MKKLLSFLMIIGMSGALTAANSGNQSNPLIPAVTVGATAFLGMKLLKHYDLTTPNVAMDILTSGTLGVAAFGLHERDAVAKAIAIASIIGTVGVIASDIHGYAQHKDCLRLSDEYCKKRGWDILKTLNRAPIKKN